MRRFLALILFVVLVLPLSPVTLAQDRKFEAGQIVVVNVSLVYMRAEPGKDGSVVTSLSRGDELRVHESAPETLDGSTWWHVSIVGGGGTGWVPETSIAAQEGSGELAAPAAESDSPECWTDDQQTIEDAILSFSEPPAMVIDPDAQYVATISTSSGDIVLALDAANAPIATNNFYCLASVGYYNFTSFHRVSPDFFIQGGDATGEGNGLPGYVVPSDSTTGSYPEGSIALANAAPDENGAQFFIAATDLTGEIPDDYPVFGQVIAGLDNVTAISREPVQANPRGELSEPVDPVIILSVYVEVAQDELGPPMPAPAETAVAEDEDAPEQAGIVLTAKDIAYDPTSITIEASDLPVTITLDNVGAAEHDFVIDALDIEVHAAPGTKAEIVIPAGAAPGEYQFYCSISGHKEAGMVGTLTIEAGSSASEEEPSGSESCDGLTEYQNAYDAAFGMAIAMNPDAVSILLEIDSAFDTGSALEALTPSELRIVSDFATDAANALEGITPPAYAASWHDVEIDAMRLLAKWLDSAIESDVTTAAAMYYFQFNAIDTDREAALIEASGCPAFVTWATETDDDDTWNQARAGAIAVVLADEANASLN